MEVPTKTATFCVILLLLSCSLAFGQTYKVLWSFGSVPNDGEEPLGNLVADQSGNLYGTTKSGGAYGFNKANGTVFELSPNSDGTWSEAILYNFCSVINNEGYCLDGQWPTAGLVFDQAGNLYGTTSSGGAATGGKRAGTVFELSPPSVQGGAWTETVLYSFCAGSNTDCQDGGDPVSQLIFDASGNLYGTTSEGGAGLDYSMGGTVFELSPSASGWALTTLYSFCVNGNGRKICPDGNLPMAGVTFDKSGNLYGTTQSGGAKNSQGAGTVYELSPTANGWVHNTILAFNPDGGRLQGPSATVTFDPAGNLYSTASFNGVFELMPKTQTERRFLFNINDGSSPEAGVLVDPKNKAVYGTTVSGGTNNGGVVFKITTSGQETGLYNFCQQEDCTDGKNPYASLIEDAAGNLYGTASAGGSNNGGVVFEITP